MPPKQSTIEGAIGAQRAAVDNAAQRLADLQTQLQALHGECVRVAADQSTYGVHSNGQLDQARQAVRNIEGQIAEAQQELDNATASLQHLERAQERAQEREAGAGKSKASVIAERIETLRATLDEVDARGRQLYAAMAGDPDNEDLHEDIALNNEKRKAAQERLELYEQAHAAAVREDQANEKATRTLDAFTNRDKAVDLAQQRVKVADKIDQYLAGLAPLMREWRDIDEAVGVAVRDALRPLCEGMDFNARSRVAETATRAASPGSIAGAVVQALLLADVGNVARDYVTFPFSSTLEARRHPITAKERAAQTIPRLVGELDEAITKAGVRRG